MGALAAKTTLVKMPSVGDYSCDSSACLIAKQCLLPSAGIWQLLHHSVVHTQAPGRCHLCMIHVSYSLGLAKLSRVV